MLSESYVLPGSPDYPLAIAAKRYWATEFEGNATVPTAQTLILLHSTSFHKETWEPTLEDLFQFASRHGSKNLIREAWSIDCPNHGESGHLNHRALSQSEFPNFTCEKYAQAAHRFIMSGLADFRSRNLVGIGHSLGANAMLLLQEVKPSLPFSFLVIVEPMVSAKGQEPLAPLRRSLVNRASKRREFWPSRTTFKEELGAPDRHAAKWDSRVLDSFVNHAIYRNQEENNFALACKPEQEVAMYRDDLEGPTKPVQVVDRICHSIPIHLILGGIHDLIPEQVHRDLLDTNSGRNFATVVTMKDVGHLIPQEDPSRLAQEIFTALLSDKNTQTSSRL
ncbi:hypothetical protein D9613_011338 [Agrocybe pediades]|uniref:AB hydrolase-1 domain-containing protein n=1 Tax=Agrocybe pediades TaxID=84607 RepID=A0A8H4QRX7_9AGAR|nr:hypothetical protein D9613_011338 [Agrocybe pediades]